MVNIIMKDFHVKLDEALSEYGNDPGVHTSIRISSDRAAREVLREDREPQSGIYWWAPKHGMDDKIEWAIVSFWHSMYGDDIVHPVFWDKFMIKELVATLNLPRTAIQGLMGLYNSLPRGRIIKKQSGICTVHHGDDIPAGGVIQQVFNEFKLPTDTPIIAAPHEAMSQHNHQQLCQIINIDLGLNQP